MERKGWKVIPVTDESRDLMRRIAELDRDFTTYIRARQRIQDEANAKILPLFEAGKEALRQKCDLMEEIRSQQTDGAWVIDMDACKKLSEDT